MTKVENLKINHNYVQNIMNNISPWFNLIGPALLLAVFIGFILGFAFKLIYFLFLGVLIFFLASIFKWGLDFSASYKTAVLSSTLALFIDLIITHTAIYTGFYGFPFLFTLISLCVATINFQAQNIDNK